MKEEEKRNAEINKVYDEIKSKIATIAIIIVAIILAVNLGLLIWIYCFNDGKIAVNNSSHAVEEVKRRKLDINGDLAHALYNKVSREDEAAIPKDWIINQYADAFGDFIVADENETEKMRLVAFNTDEKDLKYLSNDEFVKYNLVATNAKGQYSKFENRPISYFEKSYIENIYHRLYGENANLDTSVDMISTVYKDTYTYVPAIDGYLKYESIGKGGVGPTGEQLSIKLEEGYIEGNKVELIENIYISYYNVDKDEYGTKKKKYSFKYTFEKENDIYKFVSRKKI